MRRVVLTIGVAMIAGALFNASIAQAAGIPGPIVTVNGSTVFQSNGFESDTVGALPSVTMAGSWSTRVDGDAAISVSAGGSGGVPAAAYGSNVLGLYMPQDAGSINQPLAEAALSSPAVSGDSVTAKFSVNADSFGNTSTGFFVTPFVSAVGQNAPFPNRVNWLGFAFQHGDLDGAVSTAGLGANDLVVAYYNGSWSNIVTASGGTNMGMSPDAWHSIEVDATVGGTWTVSIDGVTSGSMGMKGDNIAALDIEPSSANATQFYVDGPNIVPEPSTLMLLVTGLVGLLAYAWRKRK
jgi:hypothetical protein